MEGFFEFVGGATIVIGIIVGIFLFVEFIKACLKTTKDVANLERRVTNLEQPNPRRRSTKR